MSSKRWAVRSLISLVVAALIVLPLALWPARTVDIFQPSNQMPLPVDVPLGQTFIAPSDNLSSVGFFFVFDSFDRELEARVVIFEDGSDKALRAVTKTLKAERRIPPSIIHPTYFDFSPIVHSNSETFRVELDAEGPGLSAMRAAGESYPSGSSFVDEMPQGFDLAFATRHSGDIVDRFNRLARRFAPGLNLSLLIGLAWLTILSMVAAFRQRT